MVSSMADSKEKNEIVYFQCEKQLKAEFYRVAQERGLSPGALLRAFMRKVIKSHADGKQRLGDVD